MVETAKRNNFPQVSLTRPIVPVAKLGNTLSNTPVNTKAKIKHKAVIPTGFQNAFPDVIFSLHKSQFQGKIQNLYTNNTALESENRKQ